MRGLYWTDHEYHKRKVRSSKQSHDSNFKGWMGWRNFQKICDLLKREKEGRKLQLLTALFFTGSRSNELLTANRSNFSIMKDYIRVTDFPTFKRLKHKRYEQGFWEHRNFLINLKEPETDVLVQLLDSLGTNSSTSKLFDFGYGTLYREIVGITQADLFPHVIRAHRASQLIADYRFDMNLLKTFFGWSKDEMATYYIKLQMRDIQQCYEQSHVWT